MPVNQVTRLSYILVISSFLCFSLWSLYSVFLLDNTLLYQENGLLENIQVLLLVVTFLTFLLPALYQQRNDKLILLFFALLSFNFILREVDVEEFELPNILILLGSGIGRKILLAIGFIGIIFYALLNAKYYANLSICLLKSSTGILLFLSAVFLFLGGFFEEGKFQHHTYFEELSELVGYVLFFLSSLILLDKSLDEGEI